MCDCLALNGLIRSATLNCDLFRSLIRNCVHAGFCVASVLNRFRVRHALCVSGSNARMLVTNVRRSRRTLGSRKITTFAFEIRRAHATATITLNIVAASSRK